MARGSVPNPWRHSRHANPPASAPKSDRGSSGDTEQRFGRDSAAPLQPAGAAGAGWGWAEGTRGPGAPDPAPAWSATTSARAASRREFARAPLPYLWISYGAALLALALSLIPLGIQLWIVGWAIAAFLGLGAALIFTIRDAARQGEVFYLHVPSTRWLYQGAIAVSLAAIAATALRIALVVGRLG